jgi:LPS export ABC transporter protein LptC/lipopolysaccharide transport protein LptA
MIRWQRRARLFIAGFAVIFAAVVFFAFQRRSPAPAAAPDPHMAPGAVLEGTGGHLERFKLSREDLTVDYEKLLTYPDGKTKLGGVKITSTNRSDGRTFIVTGKEAEVHENPTIYAIDGDVRLAASDGLTAKSEHATYAENDGTVRAPGPVEFAKGRMSGSGLGMEYDKRQDVMTILDQAVVHIKADHKGAGAADVTSGSAAFARRDKYVRFDRAVKVQRGAEVTEADNAVAHLSADEKRVESLELHGNPRVVRATPTAGGLQAMTGRDMNLAYAPDGEALQHVLVGGDAVIQLAGAAGKPGRQLAANAIDISLAPDGSTPTALAGREAVQLTFPAEPGVAARTIRAASMDAIGEAGRGLTKAHFSNNVEYRETGGTVDRTAKSATLDAALKPGMSSIDEAKFVGNVRFVDGKMAAVAAVARYALESGHLELSGTEPPGNAVPHMANEQIAIDAAVIDVTLDGPKVKATGKVRSVLQPAKKGEKPADGKTETKMPSMLKQDQPVNVTADDLAYDGTASKAVYTGGAQLFQADTTIRADTIGIDDKSGDLTASGAVATTVTFEQVKKEQPKGAPSGAPKAKERVQSIGKADDFFYEEAARRATYTGSAHLSGPEGDMTADKIELYLKPSGDELDRAEGYDAVTLRESGRKTTGSRVSYFAADERYVVTGRPVTIADECGYETAGRTLTFHKATDTIVVDGERQFRTYTKGSGKCPES